MTPFTCSVHTHCALCDGKGAPAEMAEAAFQAGVTHYGFSCHSHTPIETDRGYVLPRDMTAYRAEVLRLRELYRGRMEILLGIELDSCADVTAEGFDYWIGSVHYVPGENGRFYGVDIDRETFCDCREELCGGDALSLAERYFREVGAVAERRPAILGHLDLIRKFNEGNALFDESAPRYRAAALEALHRADPEATLLEINTGAMARGYRADPYPALFLLREWRAMGGRIILTSDAHSPETILFGYEAAADLARRAGFHEAAVLTLAGPRACPL